MYSSGIKREQGNGDLGQGRGGLSINTHKILPQGEEVKSEEPDLRPGGKQCWCLLCSCSATPALRATVGPPRTEGGGHPGARTEGRCTTQAPELPKERVESWSWTSQSCMFCFATLARSFPKTPGKNLEYGCPGVSHDNGEGS